MTLRQRLRVACGVPSLALAAYLVWFSIEGLRQESTSDDWFFVITGTMAPTMVALALQIPDLVAPADPEARSRLGFDPLSTACLAVLMLGCTVALGLELGEWWLGVVAVLAGVVLAHEYLHSMSYVRGRLFESSHEPYQPAASARHIGFYVARQAMFFAALGFVASAAGYVLLGDLGLIAGLGLEGVYLAWFGFVLFQWRRRALNGRN